MTTTQGTDIKRVARVLRSADRHWVGDGFPVRTLFSYPDLGPDLSPFLLLDHAGPTDFTPTDQRRGVGAHPHRGFETVTIVYAGEVEHRDSAGGGGRIGPGDVQWMTAASGLVHEEFHGRNFARRGGRFEMVQLWVNLPAADKRAAPRYQTILDRDIPRVVVPGGGGTARIISGEFAGVRGPALTFTPIDVWDLRFESGTRGEVIVPDDHTTALVVLRGALDVNGGDLLRDAEVALFERAGSRVAVHARADATALLLAGAPIHEPIVGQGPFVMNTQMEIRQAMADYVHGRMGRLN